MPLLQISMENVVDIFLKNFEDDMNISDIANNNIWSLLRNCDC